MLNLSGRYNVHSITGGYHMKMVWLIVATLATIGVTSADHVVCNGGTCRLVRSAGVSVNVGNVVGVSVNMPTVSCSNGTCRIVSTSAPSSVSVSTPSTKVVATSAPSSNQVVSCSNGTCRLVNRTTSTSGNYSTYSNCSNGTCSTRRVYYRSSGGFFSRLFR